MAAEELRNGHAFAAFKLHFKQFKSAFSTGDGEALPVGGNDTGVGGFHGCGEVGAVNFQLDGEAVPGDDLTPGAGPGVVGADQAFQRWRAAVPVQAAMEAFQLAAMGGEQRILGQTGSAACLDQIEGLKQAGGS